MSAIYQIKNTWRTILLSEQSSFRGVPFHLESGSRLSGRRTVVHEYPKRNLPYAEDMGRSARRFAFNGYLIYRPVTQGPQFGGANPDLPPGNAGNYIYFEYTQNRTALRDALEADDAGWLVHPVFMPGGGWAVCERYSMTEVRQRGGYTEFEMNFVEAGTPGNSIMAQDTKSVVVANADNNDKAAKSNLENVISAQASVAWLNQPTTSYGQSF